MEDSPFTKRPVDSLGNKPKSETSFPPIRLKPRKQLIAKILGVCFTLMLAFFVNILYQEYSANSINQTPNDSSFRSIDTNKREGKVNGISSSNSLLPTKQIDILVSNGPVDESIRIKTIKIAPFTDVNLTIIKPDQSEYKTTVTTKITGIVDLELDSFILKKAGQYQIYAEAKGFDKSDIQNFILYPGKVSSSTSTVTANKNNTYINEFVEISVTLLDQFSNPIENREVSIISTRIDVDTISLKETDKTNSAGLIQYKVTSSKIGKSSYLILDKKSGITLDSKIDITYSEPDLDKNNTDKNLSFLNFFMIPQAHAATASYFTIEGPTEYLLDEDTSIVIKAFDSSNKLVNDYTGKVIFLTNNESAGVFPSEYTFVEEDLGEYIINIKFTQPGAFLLSVQADGNASVKGEKQIVVKQPEGGFANLSKPQILAPPKSSGNNSTILNSPEVDIAGKSDPDTTIEVYSDSNKLGEILSNSSGLFFFRTKALVDGKHDLTVRAIDENGDYKVSDKVSINIDTTSAILDKGSLNITPSIVKPGEIVTLMLEAEPNLDSAKAIVNKMYVELLEDKTKAGTYTGQFQAPTIPDLYIVDVELKDNITNPVLFKNKGELTVQSGSIIQNIEPDPNLDTETQQQSPDTGPREIMIAVFLFAIIIVWKIFGKVTDYRIK